MKDQTLAIHAGFKSDPTTNSTAVPIYQTVAYEFESAQHVATPGDRGPVC
jgi:O-acetylhomoserine (thiol)-lyase